MLKFLKSLISISKPTSNVSSKLAAGAILAVSSLFAAQQVSAAGLLTPAGGGPGLNLAEQHPVVLN